MPHSDAYSHSFGGQTVHQSPPEKPPTAEHHNHGHDLLRHARRKARASMPVQWPAAAVEFFSQKQIGLSTKWRSIIPDTTIKKVEAGTSPQGEMGQKYLVAGKRVSMRLWVQEPEGKLKGPTKREYETVGYVISGRARPDLEGQTLNLKAGGFVAGPSRSDAPLHESSPLRQ